MAAGLHGENGVPVPLDGVGAASAVGGDVNTVAMSSIEARASLLAGANAVVVANLHEVFGCDLVSVPHAAHDKCPAYAPHEGQEHSAHD